VDRPDQDELPAPPWHFGVDVRRFNRGGAQFFVAMLEDIL
jgi:hypothetical protein